MERPLRRSMLETRLLLLLPIGSPGVMLPKELKADMDEAETPVAKEEEGGRRALPPLTPAASDVRVAGRRRASGSGGEPTPSEERGEVGEDMATRRGESGLGGRSPPAPRGLKEVVMAGGGRGCIDNEGGGTTVPLAFPLACPLSFSLLFPFSFSFSFSPPPRFNPINAKFFSNSCCCSC